jgi:hypothetical protein
MKFLFSQREKARKAAIAAHERYEAEGLTSDGRRIDYWAYVVNAAVAALDEPKGKYNVLIETDERTDGWWAQVWLFHGTPGEPPLHIGPEKTEELARKRGADLADNLTAPSLKDFP